MSLYAVSLYPMSPYPMSPYPMSPEGAVAAIFLSISRVRPGISRMILRYMSQNVQPASLTADFPPT
jgi:hypothetical protein